MTAVPNIAHVVVTVCCYLSPLRNKHNSGPYITVNFIGKAQY